MVFRLPRTSTIKMIDIWLLFAMIIPFLEVILHTQMAKERQFKNQEEDKSVMKGNTVQVLPITDEREMKTSLDLAKEQPEKASKANRLR